LFLVFNFFFALFFYQPILSYTVNAKNKSQQLSFIKINFEIKEKNKRRRRKKLKNITKQSVDIHFIINIDHVLTASTLIQLNIIILFLYHWFG